MRVQVNLSLKKKSDTALVTYGNKVIIAMTGNSNLPTGFYVYHISSPDFTAFKKFMRLNH